MPLYEYECEAENGRRFEIIQKFSDPILTVCPSCGGPVKKLLSSPAIQFKGSGFYINDYKKSGDTGGSSKSTSGSSSSSSSSSSSDSSTSTTTTSTTTDSSTKTDKKD